MNSEQVAGQVRLWLAVFSGIAGALGWTWFDGLSASIAAAAGPIAALGLSIWSLVSKKNANIVTAAAAVPGVSQIVLQQNDAGRALAPNTVTPPNVTLPSGNKPL